MIIALFRAIGDLLSPDFRSILLKSFGLTIGLFLVLFFGVEYAVSVLTEFSWPWADWALGIGTGLVMLVAFFFLMAPVTAIFAGLYLDEIAARVEHRHYPGDPPGSPLAPVKAIITGLQFALVVLAVNLAALPTVLLGIGAFVLLAANAYLLSREYFEMIAMRHMAVEDARNLRRQNAVSVFIAGLVPALFSMVPVVNIAVPLLATSYFTHIFKQVPPSSA